MQCAIFALIGVVVGALMTCLSRGEVGAFVKKKCGGGFEVSEDEEENVKGGTELMRQWQNLLSYGAEKSVDEQGR